MYIGKVIKVIQYCSGVKSPYFTWDVVKYEYKNDKVQVP